MATAKKFSIGITAFFALCLLIVIAFGIRDWRAAHTFRAIIAPVAVAAFIIAFYFFAKSSGNDLGPR